MDRIPVEEKRRLVGDAIDEWRRPECGALAYTHKDQDALIVTCAGDHGNTLVWMEQITYDAAADGAAATGEGGR